VTYAFPPLDGRHWLKADRSKRVQNAVQNDHISNPFCVMLHSSAPLESNISCEELLLRFFAFRCVFGILLPLVAAALKKSAQQRQQQQNCRNWGGSLDTL
jgi:hypothetical protein